MTPFKVKRSSLACLKSKRKRPVPNDRNPNLICLNRQSLGFRHYLDFGRSDFGISLYYLLQIVSYLTLNYIFLQRSEEDEQSRKLIRDILKKENSSFKMSREENSNSKLPKEENFSLKSHSPAGGGRQKKPATSSTSSTTPTRPSQSSKGTTSHNMRQYFKVRNTVESQTFRRFLKSFGCQIVRISDVRLDVQDETERSVPLS